MKLLSIGNSFSTDSHRFLHSIAEQNGVSLECYNLFIGGCSLETHWLNYAGNNAFYDLEINGNEATRKISINEALTMENQKEMYLRIKESSKKASDLINAEIIPTGDIVQFVRENIPEFDYENGGLSLCRDSFHLSEDYGRFLAGAVWFKKLTGQELKDHPFMNFDYEILKKLITAVNEKV